MLFFETETIDYIRAYNPLHYLDFNAIIDGLDNIFCRRKTLKSIFGFLEEVVDFEKTCPDTSSLV